MEGASENPEERDLRLMSHPPCMGTVFPVPLGTDQHSGAQEGLGASFPKPSRGLASSRLLSTVPGGGDGEEAARTPLPGRPPPRLLHLLRGRRATGYAQLLLTLPGGWGAPPRAGLGSSFSGTLWKAMEHLLPPFCQMRTFYFI